MNNLLLEIIYFSACLIAYFFAAKLFLNSKVQTAFVLLILAGLALRIFTSCDFYLHIWDERYHALVAKNMMQHPFKPTLYDTPLLNFDYKEWYNSNIFVHKQPLPLWIMAGSMCIFGVNELALRLPDILFSSLAIYLTFQIGSYLFNKRVGFIAAFLHSVNGLVIELAAGRVATDHYDSYFLFFIELAIFFSIKFADKRKVIYNILTGICIGFAVLTKWLPALIVLPIWLLVVYDSGKFQLKEILFYFFGLIFTAILIFLPWQIYIEYRWPLETAWERTFNRMHITQVLDGRDGSWWYFLDRIRINYGELIYLPIIWILYKYYKNKFNYKILSVLIWALIPIIFFSFVKTKMQGYILFAAPALFIINAVFISDFFEKKFQGFKQFGQRILIAIMLLLPLRYTIERTKIFSNVSRSPEWVISLKQLNEKNINNGVLFNYSRPIEAMFYTDLIVYPQLPDRKKILELQNLGYTVIINDKDSIPNEIKTIPGIILNSLTNPD